MLRKTMINLTQLTFMRLAKSSLADDTVTFTVEWRPDL